MSALLSLALVALCGGFGGSQGKSLLASTHSFPLNLCTEISSFTWQPPGVVPPSTVLVFECLGRNGGIRWQVGNVVFSESSDRFTVQVSNTEDGLNSTLSFRAKAGDNQTTVICQVSGPSKTVNDSSIITIASESCIATSVVLQSSKE